MCIAEAERLPGGSSAYFDAVFATTREILTAYLAEHYDLDSAAVAEDLLARTVLPRLFRTLLNVEDALKGDPAEEALPEVVDLAGIRRLVSAALPA